MKKLISIALCFGLVFMAVGCKKNMTPEEIEQKITKELQDSKQLDAHINMTISGEIKELNNQSITVDADVKANTEGEFPVMHMDGKVGIEGMMTIPLTLYLDENGMIISAMGMTQKEDLPEDSKEEFKKALKMSENVEVNLKKTVEKGKVDDKDALEIKYDTEEINKLIKSLDEDSGQEIKIESYVAHYILKNRDELDYMTADYLMTIDGKSFSCNATVTYNSIGQPVEITPPSVDDSNSGSGLNLLPNQN